MDRSRSLSGYFHYKVYANKLGVYKGFRILIGNSYQFFNSSISKESEIVRGVNGSATVQTRKIPLTAQASKYDQFHAKLPKELTVN